jgi:hypothetical protein
LALPENPVIRRPVLLVPERFLRTIPTAEPDDFWAYAWGHDAETLRADFNYDIARNVSASRKAQLARQHPDLVIRYLRSLEAQPKPPYDLHRDQQVLVQWYEQGREIAAQNPLSFVPVVPERFPEFIEAIIKSFSHGLEESDTWRLLWDDNGRHRSEKHVQSLFRSAVIHYCRANGVDLSGRVKCRPRAYRLQVHGQLGSAGRRGDQVGRQQQVLGWIAASDAAVP